MSRVAALLERARQQTGLDDFGAESFREGLGILVASLDEEANLNETGRSAMDMQLVDLLANRLQVEHWYRRHPEIGDQEILAPLFGLGLPRTGSTALACLLGADPAARSIRNFESMWPCPPPQAATIDSDPRVLKAQASMARRARLFPRMTAMLPSTATSPTECQLFMGQDFKSQIFQAFAHIPTYVQWLNHRADMVPTYQYVKRVLKLLQWHCPPTRWRLKNPSHSLFIGALDRVFPDARFVMTHRDVASVVPSVADLYYELHKPFVDRVDLPAIGRDTRDFCALGMQRMIAFRAAGNESRFFDIHFAAFQQDPFPVLDALYAFLGEQLTPEARERMQAWRRGTPREPGYQRTDMAAFGLDPTSLREQFAFYCGRFNVARAAA
ncbi:MAG TPA: sulfotransferase [Steroidobacteraceae bacterium]|nr:sulfotransferase [Steroidobacteraceae bacterium]